MSRHYTRDVSLYFVGQLFQQAINFTTGLLIARWLGPQEYGSLGIARNIFAIALVVGPLGLDIALLRLIPQQSDEDQVANVQRLRSVRLIALLINMLVVTITVALAGLLERNVYHAPHLALYLDLTMAALPFAADLSVLAAIYRARGNTSPQILATMILQPVVRVAALVAFMLAGLGVVGVVVSNLVASLATFAALSIHLARLERGDGVGYLSAPLVQSDHLQKVFAYSLWLAVMALAYNMLRNIDILVLGTHRSTSVVGNYVALSVIAQVIQIYPQALSQTLGPTVASAFAAGNTAGIRSALNDYLRRSSLLVGPIAGGIAAFGPWLDLLFGRRFSFSPGLCLTLSLAYAVSAILGPLGFGLSMTGRHRREFGILVLGAVWATLACLGLAPRFGAIGVAAGVTSAYLVINIARSVSTAASFGFVPGSLSDVAPPVGCLLVGWIIRVGWDRFLPHNLLTCSVGVVCFLVLSAAVYWLFLLRSAERAWSAAFARRLARMSGFSAA